MSLFTVQPTGAAAPIEVYGGSDACDSYLAAAIGDGSDAYAAADPNTRLKLLVSATRFIERQDWRGTSTTPAVGGTTLDWPRTGIDGVDPSTVPLSLVEAVFELVALLADDPDVLAATDSGSNVSSLGAGSAQISFFRPTSITDGNATYLPPVLNQLVGQWLATSDPSATLAGIATGTNRHSDFRTCSVCNCDPCRCSGVPTRTWPL